MTLIVQIDEKTGEVTAFKPAPKPSAWEKIVEFSKLYALGLAVFALMNLIL